jgi:hypothetical protein
MADKIVLVKPLHNDDDGSLRFVVEPAEKGVVEPGVGRLPAGLGQGVVRLLRVVQNDDVGAPAGEDAANRRRKAPAPALGLEVVHGLAPTKHIAKEGAVEGASHQPPAGRRQVVGQILSIAGADHLFGGLVAKEPRDEGDRHAMRLQMARRQIDNEALDLAAPHRLQLRGHDLDMRGQIKA